MLRLNIDFDRKNSKAYTPSEVASVRCYECSEGTIKFRSDIALIFNQQRIAKTLGVDTFAAWLGKFNTKQTGIDTSKFSDAQLLQFIKARNIQSPSELLAWSDYLNTQAEGVREEINNLIKSEQERIAAAAREAAEKQAAQQASANAANIQVPSQN